MFEVLLVLALTWPADCDRIGALYEGAARIRDKGLTLERALSATNDRRIQLAMRHVYGRPDMTPEQWRWFTIGVCVGQDDGKTIKAGRVFAAQPASELDGPRATRGAGPSTTDEIKRRIANG